jgi:hypothetical protein
MLEDNDIYESDYAEDDEEETPDAALENQYYNAKGYYYYLTELIAGQSLI